MTNKVEQGLSVCLDGMECPECPYFDDSMCIYHLKKDALTLLQEKDAEIARLKQEKEFLASQLVERIAHEILAAVTSEIGGKHNESEQP